VTVSGPAGPDWHRIWTSPRVDHRAGGVGESPDHEQDHCCWVQASDAGLVLAVGSLIASARDQAAGAVERCLELAELELATARAFERFAPDALAEASVLALQPDPWRESEQGDA
jgi:hypothetical protein